MLKEFPTHFSHYQILNVKHNSDKKTIKSAFITLSKKYHPDFNSNLSLHEKIIVKKNYQKIIQSYKFLSNDSNRTTYDQTIRKSNLKRTPMKTYYTGGINQTRNAYTSRSQYSTNTSSYANFHQNLNPNYGANYDVPHFDYDNHLRGNLWFERRMINKRINNPSEPNNSQTNNTEQKQYQQYNHKRNLDDEINYTLNLQRFGNNHHQDHSKQVSYSFTTAKTTILLMGVISVIMGSNYI